MGNPDHGRSYLWDGTHILVAGVTGANESVDAGGKTATSNWLAQQVVDGGHADWAIAFAPKGPGLFFDNRGGDAAVVGTAREAADAYAEGARFLEWVPDTRGDVAAQHDDATRFAEGLAGGGVFVHDDAVTYAGSDGLAWATALAGNPTDGDGIKSVVVTQDPWDLPRKSVRTNLNVLVHVGPVTSDARRYFDVMKMSWAADVVEDRHTDPYVFSAVIGERVDTYEPVPAAYAR
jgi:hypothetical protein